MFQMLDDDLGPVGTQFAFDHFRQQSEEKRATKDNACGHTDNVIESLDAVIICTYMVIGRQ